MRFIQLTVVTFCLAITQRSYSNLVKAATNFLFLFSLRGIGTPVQYMPWIISNSLSWQNLDLFGLFAAAWQTDWLPDRHITLLLCFSFVFCFCRFLPHMVKMFPYAGHRPAKFDFEGPIVFARSSGQQVRNVQITYSSVRNDISASFSLTLDSEGQFYPILSNEHFSVVRKIKSSATLT